MSGKRFVIDCFIPLSVYNAMPTAQKIAIRDRIRDLKALAVKLNEGKTNEEMTVKATIHDCYHDEGTNKPCGPEADI